MTEHLEEHLRTELHRRAERAPGGALLAEQIIAAARTEVRPKRHNWPTWAMPLLTAGAVAAIVAGVFVGVAQLRPTAGPAGPGLGTTAPTAAHSAPAPAPTVSAPVAPPIRGEVHSSASKPTPANAVGLHNFVATDLTFYGTDDGWALGTADCLAGTGTCPAMVRTTDGGRTWRSVPQPPADVTGIRFATDRIGYAFSDSVLEMTTDGGQTWSTQSGGAIALETLNGNVVRLVSPHGGCPGPCQVRAEYAPIGSDAWTAADLGPVDVGSAHLVRSDGDVYVLVTRHPAGGAPDQQSTLYASTDNGAHWVSRGEPCAQAGGRDGETDSAAVAASPGATVTVLCVPRAAGRQFVSTSTDAGASFTRAAGTLPAYAAELLTGDPSTVLVAAGSGAYRSTDGGASWARIPAVGGTATFVGFESTTLGRIVTDGGRTIWTTRDAGASWTAFTFPS